MVWEQDIGRRLLKVTPKFSRILPPTLISNYVDGRVRSFFTLKASYIDGVSFRAAQNGRQTELEETPKVPTEPAAMAAGNKKRPRLDLNAAVEGNRERKRGKSMFGILVGTLNKAKIEDKERNASEAVSMTTSTTQQIAQNDALL